MKKGAFLPITAVVLLVAGVFLLRQSDFLPQKTYSAEAFGIEQLRSEVDFDADGVDDYTDIMLGARRDAENRPKYDGSYVEGGYPPDNIGVCTDVVWRAFKNAGYSLRDMVDRDIAERQQEYNIQKADSNIDFRRVANLHVFFKKYAQELTTDPSEIREWQPGDIVVFGENKHIGIVSDKRNKDGRTYIIHQGGQTNREEDYLRRAKATGHYRFNASGLSTDVLVAWSE